MLRPLHRRRFLERCSLLAAGAAGTALVPPLFQAASAFADEARIHPEQRLKELGIKLPEPSEPVATYVPTVQVGNLLYVAGHGPRTLDGGPVRGKLGDTMGIGDGQHAARLAGYRILSSVRAALGSLDRVERLVRTLGMVNSAPDFTDQPKVVNGFSDLIVEIFGAKRGKGARSAVGMASLPGGIPVEIETVFQVKS